MSHSKKELIVQALSEMDRDELNLLAAVYIDLATTMVAGLPDVLSYAAYNVICNIYGQETVDKTNLLLNTVSQRLKELKGKGTHDASTQPQEGGANPHRR